MRDQSYFIQRDGGGGERVTGGFLGDQCWVFRGNRGGLVIAYGV